MENNLQCCSSAAKRGHFASNDKPHSHPSPYQIQALVLQKYFYSEDIAGKKERDDNYR